jgi:hypothetical protein
VEVINGSSEMAASDYSQSTILDRLDFCNVCWFNVGDPNGCTVTNNWLHQCIVCKGERFLVKPPCIISDGFQDRYALAYTFYNFQGLYTEIEMGVLKSVRHNAKPFARRAYGDAADFSRLADKEE